MMNAKSFSMTVLICFLFIGTLYAQDYTGPNGGNTPSQGDQKGPGMGGSSSMGPGSGGGQPPAPPADAITACSGKVEGVDCLINIPDGTTKAGVCAYTPDKKYFVCRPNDMEFPPAGQRNGSAASGMAGS